MRIEIPDLSVVALIGASGSGKTTFAGKHFKPTEVLSSDYFRGLIADDENDQTVTSAAFESLYYIANRRLDLGKLTVIDATNVQKMARTSIVKLAREQNCLAVAIVFDYPAEICHQRNEDRSDRNFGRHVVENHTKDLKRSLRSLKKEGFRYIYVLKSPEEADQVEIVRTKLWNDKREETGPFDIIGDIHGCYDELCDLLTKMGYLVDKEACRAVPPQDRKALFLGDLCDRGPKNMEVLRMVMAMVKEGSAICVPGNHDVKLQRKLRGAQVQVTHGLETTLAQLEEETPEFQRQVEKFIDGLVSHYVLDGGRLVVAHAGLKEKLQGRGSGRVRDFCLYGETTGENDEFGLPVRLNWAAEYRGRARVVYGHTPSWDVQTLNNTVCVDTGCVFGGHLSAYRYPEDTICQVPARQVYYEPVKPLKADMELQGDMLNIQDVLGRGHISTRLYRNITVQEENSAAALEIMSRFAADPHWLIYLPPTMSPCETSGLEEYLEHPREAFGYYKKCGIAKVVCEQKHMGSRSVIVLCRDQKVAVKRFGVHDGSMGIIYTRTGRRFFDGEDVETERILLERLEKVLTQTGFWEAFDTDWVCLDTELMPWSAKAQKLLAHQYAPVGRAGHDGLGSAVEALEKAVQRQTADFAVTKSTSGQNVDLREVLGRYRERREDVDRYTEAYRQYCWTVDTVEDYRIAPFHILATENRVWSGENHITHMDTIRKYMCGIDPVFQETNHIVVDLADEASVDKGVDWWLELTGSGGEGMVVKPWDLISADQKNRIVQPAVKCRGREYLRIIYGPEYTLGNHMARLKKRSLHKKRKLALAEFSLGMESLERFVGGEPLYRVHECVFAVLAMESEPVDPRL